MPAPASSAPRFFDSHCHLTFPELAAQLPDILHAMQLAGVAGAIVISTEQREWASVVALAQAQPRLWATIGVHPDTPEADSPSLEALMDAARAPKVVAIGETGLDYFRLEGRSVADMQWQRDRFATHMAAAQALKLPLVIHTRSASADTLAMMREGQADQVGGVMHCFTETLAVAKAALDLGFYISFSGILTFKNAAELREVAAYVPLDRCLIETDSPYLAPVPHRGKTNTPAYVPHVGQQLAQIKGLSVEAVAQATTANCCRLFRLPLEEL